MDEHLKAAIESLERRLADHDCGGNECGRCCVCLQKQVAEALKLARDENVDLAVRAEAAENALEFERDESAKWKALSSEIKRERDALRAQRDVLVAREAERLLEEK